MERNYPPLVWTRPKTMEAALLYPSVSAPPLSYTRGDDWMAGNLSDFHILHQVGEGDAADTRRFRP